MPQCAGLWGVVCQQGVAARTGQALEPLWQRVRRAVYQGRGELVSMHVRQGDKGREMVIHPFKDYMALAHAIRLRFPNAQSIWLSTEVQVWAFELYVTFVLLIMITQ